MALHLPNEDDTRILQKMARAFKKGKKPSARPAGLGLWGPEVYIAKMPSFGAAGTGQVDVIPGYDGTTLGKATCDLVEVNSDDEFATFDEQEIYNFSRLPVVARYFPVIRDKSGTWYSVANFILKGKADAAISKGATTGVVSIWTANSSGTEVDTGENVTGCRAWGAAITSGKIVTVQEINGMVYVGPWEC